MKFLLILVSFTQYSFANQIHTGFISSPEGALKVEYEIKDNVPIMEGDIEIDPKETENELTIQGAGKWLWFRKWPNRTIPYVIDPNMPNKWRIEWAVKHIMANTKIKMIPRDRHRDYVYFKYNGKDGGCNSSIGRRWGKQYIRVPDWCSKGSIVHEILHAIGLRHEQTRWDRNNYVKIHWNNIKKGQQHNFRRLFFYTRSYTEFDFDSIMLYGPYSFANDVSKPTITRRDGTLYPVNREGMSELDKITVAKMYRYNID